MRRAVLLIVLLTAACRKHPVLDKILDRDKDAIHIHVHCECRDRDAK